MPASDSAAAAVRVTGAIDSGYDLLDAICPSDFHLTENLRKFAAWVETASGAGEVDLQPLLQPLLVQCCLRILKHGASSEALQLLADKEHFCKALNQSSCAEPEEVSRRGNQVNGSALLPSFADLQILCRLNQQDFAQSTLAASALATRTVVRLQEPAFNELTRYLQTCSPCFVLFVNKHVLIEVGKSSAENTFHEEACSRDQASQLISSGTSRQALLKTSGQQPETLLRSRSGRHVLPELPVLLSGQEGCQIHTDKDLDKDDVYRPAKDADYQQQDLEAQKRSTSCGASWSPRTLLHGFMHGLKDRITGLKGAGGSPPNRVGFYQVIMTFAGALLSLMLTAWIMIWMAPGLGLPILLAPLGATAAVLFALLDTPGGQPRSVFFGTIVSCLIGSIVRVPLGHVLWICGPLAVAMSLAFMQLTGTVHPPGCGIALIVSLLSPAKPCAVFNDGTTEPWWRIPNAWELRRTLTGTLGARMVQGLQLSAGAMIGTCVILLAAILVRWSLPKAKRYPSYW